MGLNAYLSKLSQETTPQTTGNETTTSPNTLSTTEGTTAWFTISNTEVSNTETTWGSWTECSPVHNCRDTTIPGEACPLRSRSGRTELTDGTFIDVKSETSSGCNCEPCTFNFTDWVDGECGAAGINGGDETCPCHLIQYRYCLQLSNGAF